MTRHPIMNLVRCGTLTGRHVRGDCSGGEKLRRIREQYDVNRYALIYAYGDTEQIRRSGVFFIKKALLVS